MTETPKSAEGTPSGTLPVAGKSPAELQLQQENEELKKRLKDKDTYITNLSSEKATLEARLQSGNQHQPAEPSEQNPQPAVTADQIPVMVERVSYANAVKEKNKDLMELGLEPAIANRVMELERQGTPFREAVDKAVEEKRALVNKLKGEKPPETPPGAKGEAGGTPPPAPPPPPAPEVNPQSEVDEMKSRRAQTGL